MMISLTINKTNLAVRIEDAPSGVIDVLSGLGKTFAITRMSFRSASRRIEIDHVSDVRVGQTRFLVSRKSVFLGMID